jgi:medium-chain acyl-[acyl-carrier-protein] hydrolase
MTSARDWFVPLAAGGTRVFAFPHAGAGVGQLAGFAKAAAPLGLAVWSANLPGRQARLDESPRTEFGVLVGELTDALCDIVIDDQPYLLWGYCGGALLAFGVLRELMMRPVRTPQRLVVASYDAPDIALRPRGLSALPADRLWDYLLRTGGVPESLAADVRLRAVAEEAVRADLTLLGEYRHEPGPPVPVPITVCFGERDEQASRGALLGWRRHTTHPLDLRTLPGGHWLLDDACDELAAVTAAAASPGMAMPAGATLEGQR